MKMARVLVVEDDPGDQLLVGEAFAEVAPDAVVEIVSDARGVASRLATDPPALVLLDLNLPGFSGLDVLRQRWESAAARQVPVILFTTSSSPADVSRAYALGANAVVTKPANLNQYFRTIRSIADFWLRTVVRAPGC